MLHYFFVGMEQVFSYNIFIISTILIGFMSVSYTHLTLPTNREV